MVARNYSSTAAATQLAEACTGSATVLRVASIVGFPPVPFTLGVDVGTVYEELVTVTAIAGTNLTVVRGEDGTTGLPHEVGAVVRHVVSARDLREAANHIEADSGVHGVGVDSDVVGTNTAQVLKNKTLDGTNTVDTAALPAEVQVARLRLSSTSAASPASTAHGVQVGPTDGTNLRVDNGKILALNAGAAAGLNLRENSGVSVPEPTNVIHAATKKYVDDRVAFASAFPGASSTGWNASGQGSMGYTLLEGRLVHVVWNTLRNAAALQSAAGSGAVDGGVGDGLVATLDPAFRPDRDVCATGYYESASGGTYGCDVQLKSTGQIIILSAAPGVDFANGVPLRVAFTFIKA